MKGPFRAVRISTREELERLLEHLTHEAFRLHSLWQVSRALNRLADEYWVELNRTPAFWTLTQQSYEDSIILRLGRLLDTHPTVISIGNLLQTINANQSLLKLNIEITELERDLSSVSDADPTIRSLLTWRNEYMAHRASRHIKRGSFEALPALNYDAMKTVLDLSLEILQRYKRHLGLPPLVWSDYEEEDFKRLLELLRIRARPPSLKNGS